MEEEEEKKTYQVTSLTVATPRLLTGKLKRVFHNCRIRSVVTSESMNGCERQSPELDKQIPAGQEGTNTE